MSYILDALRKSDQQRQQAKAPTLATAQSVPAPKPSRFAFNAWLAVALIGAGILIGWLQPWQAETPPAAPSAPFPVATPPSAFQALPAPAAPPLALPAASPRYPDADVQREPGTPQRTEAASEPRAAVMPPSDLPPPTSKPAETKLSIPHAPAGNPPASPSPSSDPPERKLLSVAELPVEVRQEMPALLIAFHQYSSAPGERRVMVNNSVLRQGEFIAPGLKLEQITPDGLVLSYRGYHFQRGVR